MKNLNKCLLSILLIASFFFISCNKSSDPQQSSTTVIENDSYDDEAARNSCNPPPPPNCPPHHCPSTVPVAIDIFPSFSWTDLQHITIDADITYNNPDAAGTFRLVLRTVAGEIDSVNIIPALITGPSQTGTFHVTYTDLPYGSFPYTLHVNGRPANLQQCPTRSRKAFVINFDINK